MNKDAKPSRQHPYTYNDTFAKKIKEEINKLLVAEFIYEIKHMEWVSLIVVVPKNNGKLHVCVCVCESQESECYYDKRSLSIANNSPCEKEH